MFLSILIFPCTFSCTNCRPFICAGFSRASQQQCQKLPAFTRNWSHNMVAKLCSNNYPIHCLAPQPLGNSIFADASCYADHMEHILQWHTSNDHNYQCDLLSSTCNTITLDPLISWYSFQAMQCVADSWHSLIGSSAVMVVITFFKANLEL